MPFRDVVGHVRLLRLLSRAAAGGTLPPSLLFAGPSGIGKRRIALALAQALNCTNQSVGIAHPVTGLLPDDGRLLTDSCGHCPVCTRIARGIHPDVVVVEPGDSGAIKIDQSGTSSKGRRTGIRGAAPRRDLRRS